MVEKRFYAKKLIEYKEKEVGRIQCIL